MFLDRLRQYNLVCNHANESFELIRGQRVIQCRKCYRYASIEEFLCRIISPADSSTYALEYAQETGDIDVPCTFSVGPLHVRVLPTTVRTKLSVLHRGINLLKTIHSPFIEGIDESTADPKLFQNLMSEYLTLIDKVSCSEPENNGDKLAVKTILTNMKDAFANVDMFDQYFNVLAPYVKRAAVAADPQNAGHVFSQQPDDLPFGHALIRELERSAFIHETFSRYCIPFDVLHVMVLCYLCGEEVDVVYNLVLDLGAKLCSGYFSFPVSQAFDVGREIRKFLDRNATRTKNVRLYFHLQKYKSVGGDELVEYFSEEFLKNYSELESEIRKRIPSANSNDKLEKFIYLQTFPYMLFENNKDDSDYYAFVLALAHYVSKSMVGNGAVPKGVVSECKKIFKFAKKCMIKVRKFYPCDEKTRKDSAMYWTKEMFNLFVASDPEFGKELIQMIGVMMTN